MQIFLVLGSRRMWVVMKYTGIILIITDKKKSSERDVAGAKSAPEGRQQPPGNSDQKSHPVVSAGKKLEISGKPVPRKP